MSKQERLKVILLLAVTVAATTLLAAGLSGLELQPGQPFPFRFSLPGLTPAGIVSPGEPGFFGLLWQGLLALLMFVVLPLWLLVFILSPRARKEMLTRIPAYILWAFIIYSLTRLMQRLNPLANPADEGALSGGEMPGAGETATLVPPEFVVDPPQWLIIAATLALLALLLGAAWFFWQRSRPRQAGPLQRLAHEAEQALAQLDTGGDLTETIMRCYAQMGQVLGRQRGLHRHQAMTPREFEQHLAAAGLHDEHIGRLTRLFERFRYSAGRIGEREEREAVACLTAIVQAYGRPS